MTADPRIEQIRAVLAYVDEHEMPSPYTALRRIREIVDKPPPRPQTLSAVTCSNCGCCTADLCETTPRPRLGCFFPGDTVPAGTWVMNGNTTETRTLVGHPERDWKVMFGPCVEVHGLPTPDEWQAAVDQADAARADAEWQHTEGMTP